MSQNGEIHTKGSKFEFNNWYSNLS